MPLSKSNVRHGLYLPPSISGSTISCSTAGGVEAGGGATGSGDRAGIGTGLLQTPVYSVSDGRPGSGGSEPSLVASRTGEALR